MKPSEQRLDWYQPHGNSLSDEVLDYIVLDTFGQYGGMTFRLVDGNYIRSRHVDLDFTAGGNYARYGYVSTEEIWIDAELDESEWAPTMLHEYVETLLMLNEHSYEGSHDIANTIEAEYRDTYEFSGDAFQDFVLKITSLTDLFVD